MLKPHIVWGCLHIGNSYTDYKLAYAYRDWAKKHKAKGFVLGDNFECCIPGHKPQTMWAQVMNPSEQYKRVIEFYKPIKDSILMGCTSNHSERIWKATSLDLDENLAIDLGYLDNYVAHAGQRKIKVGKVTYKITIAHGKSVSERSPWTDAYKLLAIYPDSDIILLSHAHEMLYKTHKQFVNGKGMTVHFIKTGAVLNYARYAQRAMYQPKAKGFSLLYLDDKIKKVRVDISGELP